MSQNPFEGQELEFPFLCHFKVIAENSKDYASIIAEVLLELRIEVPVQKGNASREGKYQTYLASIFVTSKEEMQSIDRALRNIDGVKMVL